MSWGVTSALGVTVTREMSVLRNNGGIRVKQDLILPPTAGIRRNDLEIRLTAITAEKKVI